MGKGCDIAEIGLALLAKRRLKGHRLGRLEFLCEITRRLIDKLHIYFLAFLATGWINRSGSRKCADVHAVGAQLTIGAFTQLHSICVILLG